MKIFKYFIIYIIMNNHCVLATSNKCEFQNYFSDPLKVEKESEIAMTKAVMSIPVRANQYITLPYLDTTDADLMDTAQLIIMIDGIQKGITYRDIYNSYATPSLGTTLEDTLDIAEFYSGTYHLPLSNFVVYYDTVASNIETRPDINLILANAINQKFKFYWVNHKPKYTVTEANQLNTGANVTINGRIFRIQAVRNQSMELGFSVRYKWDLTEAVVGADIVPCNNATNLLWTNIQTTTVTDNANGCQILASAGGGTPDEYESIACLNKVPAIGGRVDPNGGFLRVKLHSMGANPGVGQSTQGVVGFLRGYQGGIESPGAKMVAEDLEFGVVWEYDGTDISLTVIDGGYDSVDNTGAVAVGRRFIHKRPTGEYNTCDLNDYFFIRIIRAQNTMPNTNNFCFQLFRSTTSSWDDEGDDEPGLIYNSEHSINTPLDLVPVFMANRTGVEIHGVSMVPLTSDSRLMLDPNFEDNDLFHANPYGANTMSIKLNDFDNDDVNETSINFWGNLGFYFSSAKDASAFKNDAERQTVQAIAKYTFNYDIPRQPADVAYSFGDNSWDAIYFDNDIWGGGKNTIGYRNLSATLPRMLEVRINDLNVVTSSGSFVGSNIYDDNVVNRIVGTIPVPAEYLDRIGAFNMDISYEPYNLIYRSLRNVNDIMVNQLNIKVSAKNFESNTEDDIKDINGTLKIEFHIKKI